MLKPDAVMVPMADPQGSRRRFLQSLSRTALVLSFADVLQMAVAPWAHASVAAQQSGPANSARSYDTKARPMAPGPPSAIVGTPLGVKFELQAGRMAQANIVQP